MKKRKKEVAVKGSKRVIKMLLSAVNNVKLFIFPPKMVFYIKGESAVTPAMSRRQIKYVSAQICKTAVAAAKGRGY